MCEHVYRQCYPLMRRFKKQWSPELNCSRFLDDSSESCMKDDNGYLKDTAASSNTYLKQVNILLGLDYDYEHSDRSRTMSNDPTTHESQLRNEPDGIYEKYLCHNRLSPQHTRNNQCSLICDADIAYNSMEKQSSRFFSFILSSMCFISSILTIIVLAFNKRSSHYPNCIFMFMAFCYLVYSLLDIIGLKVGAHEHSCQQMQSHFIALINVFENNYCLVHLLMSYYFRMAALTWWFIFTLCWFLIVKFRIGIENFSRSACFYFIVWTLPALKTALIFAKGIGDVNELTGLCSVGSRETLALLSFIILPYSIYLVVGLFLILVGLYKLISRSYQGQKAFDSDFGTANTSSCQTESQTFIKKVSMQSENKDRVCLVRLGICSALCSLPLIILTLCEISDYFYTDHMKRLPIEIQLDHKQFTKQFGSEADIFRTQFKRLFGTVWSHLNDEDYYLLQPKRSFIIQIIKIFMNYLNGFLVLVLIILNKNFKSNSNAKFVTSLVADKLELPVRAGESKLKQHNSNNKSVDGTLNIYSDYSYEFTPHFSAAKQSNNIVSNSYKYDDHIAACKCQQPFEYEIYNKLESMNVDLLENTMTPLSSGSSSHMYCLPNAISQNGQLRNEMTSIRKNCSTFLQSK